MWTIDGGKARVGERIGLVNIADSIAEIEPWFRSSRQIGTARGQGVGGEIGFVQTIAGERRSEDGVRWDEGRGRGQAVYIRWMGVVTKKAGCVMTCKWLCRIERAVGAAAG